MTAVSPRSGSRRLDALAVGADGSAFVTGGNREFVLDTQKYNEFGEGVWTSRWRRFRSSHIINPVITTLAVGENGAVYVAGAFGVDCCGEQGILLVRYDADGKLLGIDRYEGIVERDFEYSLGFDGDGHVYIAGSAINGPDPLAPGDADFFLMKYTADGDQLWRIRFDAGQPGGQDRFSELVVDPEGNSYLFGSSERRGSGYDLAIVKYDTDGRELWSMVSDAGKGADDFATDFAVDPEGNISVLAESLGAFITARYTQEPAEPVAFLRGDCDGDGNVEGQVSDAVFLLTHNFLAGQRPPCLSACDADGDRRVTGVVTDAVYLLRFNFLAGPEPVAPFPLCGPGTEDDLVLGCETPPEICRQ